MLIHRDCYWSCQVKVANSILSINHSREDLEGLVHPKFIQPSYYMVPTIDASHGETSITIVDADSYSNYCLQYFLGYFTFSVWI